MLALLPRDAADALARLEAELAFGRIDEILAGLPADAVPIYLFVYGVGGLLGTMIAGRLVDLSVLRTLVGSTIATGASLALFAWAANWAVPAGVVLLLVCISVSAFVLALQLRLMEVAGRARTLGAAGNHAALNVANALGAWLGAGFPVSAAFTAALAFDMSSWAPWRAFSSAITRPMSFMPVAPTTAMTGPSAT